MAQKNRDKEIWLIPKRVNLHQTVCLIDGIIERDYSGTVWNNHKQNNLGVNLKKWGATRDGRNISQQAIRTLVASIPQYLGFLYINTETTPSTLCLTEAGIQLWEHNKDKLVKIKNLHEGKEYTLKESEDVLKQMEKLQITNPIILKDCENILLFPFRFLLKLLLKVGYLDREEIAYFLFKSRNEDEVDVLSREISSFRKLSEEDRLDIIDAFKKTHIGNITLVKASSAGYFISLCEITGIIDKYTTKPDNSKSKLTAIKIKEEFIDYVNNLLSEYGSIEPYDFKDNLKLWIEYIGNPNQKFPPINFMINNKDNKDVFILVEKDDEIIDSDIIKPEYSMEVPVFPEKNYIIKIIDMESGNILSEQEFIPTQTYQELDICGSGCSNYEEAFDTLEHLTDSIEQHCSARNFSKKVTNQLKIIAKITGNDKSEDKQLKGAYLEYYFYRVLSLLENKGIVDEVIWNGKVGKYGLPVQAPGGKTGTPDIIFKIDDVDFVLELTTIKSKSLQFSAEGSSVPDHVNMYKKTTSRNVHGIFSAPKLYERNNLVMKSTTKQHNLQLTCILIKDLLELFKTLDRYKIKSSIIEWYNN